MIRSTQRAKRIVVQALFAALAFLSMFFINFKLTFLTFDIKDSLIVIPAMAMSPLAGVLISILTVLLELLALGTTGLYGMIMNLISSLAFSLIVSSIYRLRRTVAGSYLSLGAGVIGTTAVMLIANLIVTPLYMGTSVTEVVQLIPKLLLPFNLVKYTVNAAMVLILYKPVSEVLRRTHVIGARADAPKYRVGKRTLLSWGIAVVLIAVSLVVFFAVLKGNVSLFEDKREESGNFGGNACIFCRSVVQ